LKLKILIEIELPYHRRRTHRQEGMEEYVHEVEFSAPVAQCENPLQAAPYIDQGMI